MHNDDGPPTAGGSSSALSEAVPVDWKELFRLIEEADDVATGCAVHSAALLDEFKSKAAENLADIITMQVTVNEFLTLELERLQSLNRIAEMQKTRHETRH